MSQMGIKSFPELKKSLRKKPSEVSGGQRRLFEVLLILTSKHPFCLLDEPFSGLAPVHVERLKEIFKMVKQSKGIIITDHLHRHIRDVTDHLYLLANGKTYPVKDEQQLIALGYLNEL